MPNERKLTKAELKKREGIVMDMKKNKRELVKRYGKDAEAVMYGRATKLAKQKTESMNSNKLKGMIKDALQNPKKADLNKDGKLSSYEKKRGAAIEKAMLKEDEMVFNRVKEIKHLFPRVDEDIIVDFVKTHIQDIEGASDEEIKDEFEEFFSVNYEGIPDYVNENTGEFVFSEDEVRKAADLIAKAISTADGVETKVHDLEYDEGRGAGFEISIDGEKFAGGSYVVKNNGDIVNTAIGNQHPNAVYSTIGNTNVDKVLANIKKYESGKSVVTESKSEAAYELRDIMDQLYELSDRAKQIIRSEFPSEYSRLDAYGALDFGTSSNRYDVTFEKALEDLEMYQDDKDMMQETLKEGIPTDLPPLTFDILYSSLQRGYITMEEASDKNVINAAKEVALDYEDDEEIGSSDMTFIIKEFLDDIGKKTGFEKGRLTVYDGGMMQEVISKKLASLKDKRAEIMRDMEQEAEPEGGPIADRYGDMLNKIDKAIAKLSGHGEWGPEKDTDITAQEIAKRAAMLGLEEDLDLGHEDNEPHMLKADLYRIGKYAMELYQMIDGFEGMGEVDFPHWWQSKIIKAKDMVVGAKHYLDFELKEPQIDAVVDVAAEEDVIGEAIEGKPSQDEVDKFFEETFQETHYLYSKPVEEWDEYDMSNWKAKLKKKEQGRPQFSENITEKIAKKLAKKLKK